MPSNYIDHFYVIPDLSVRGQLDVRKYDTIEEAVAAYKALPHDTFKALGIADSRNQSGALDFIQCKDGIDTLIKDYERVPGWKNAEITSAIRYLKENIKLADELQIRFITPEYDTLFYLPDGEMLTLHYPNGMTKDAACYAHADGYHFKFGWNTYHICEFAEICRDQGITIEPLKRQTDLQLSTYEIYQVRDVRRCDYAFRCFDEAKKQLSSEDYRFVCAGMLGTKTTLDDLFRIYNGDNRPMRSQMRSLSMSDIVVLNKDGNSTAYYVDDIGFKELRSFSHHLKADRKKQGIRLGQER